MNQVQKNVLEFHRAFGLGESQVPVIPPKDVCELRIKLIQEELNELKLALEAGDIIETADALGDLDYVVKGTAIVCGLDMDPIDAEVHRSNMTKVGGYKREDGKWIKPPTYSPPDLGPILDAMRKQV